MESDSKPEGFFKKMGRRLSQIAAVWAGAAAVAGSPASAQEAGPATERVAIHYHRHNGDYGGVSLWTWDAGGGRQPENNELLPAGQDDYGVYFEIDPSLYGAPDSENKEIGFLIRFNRDWGRKEGTDRVWKSRLGREVYLIEGEPGMNFQRPNVASAVRAAYLDGDNKLTLRLSRKVEPAALTVAATSIKDDAGKTYGVADVRLAPGGDGRTVIVELGEFLPFQKTSLTVSIRGIGDALIVPRDVLLDPTLFYAADAELGATCSPESTTFRVFNPAARRAWVALHSEPFGRPDAPEPQKVEMILGAAGVWSAMVPGDHHGRYYAYHFDGYRLDPSEEAFDPYAYCGSGRGGRAIVVDLRRTDPEGFRPVKRPPMGSPNDAIIYEIHVRDFTIDPNSGVEHPGKYLGFAQEGTTLPGQAAIKTGLDHLAELGITHVQLLPIQDFDNNEESPEYNWGYMPTHFNTPDGWYSTNTRGPERIVEFKKLVQALHAKGIRVVMDVVYNHTDNSTPFNKLVPDYYYRMTPDGSFWNGSGTGNEFRSESPMGRKFIVDSCVFWAKEYGVSGFRFDLMGLIDFKTLQEIRDALHEVDPTIIVYGEPWAAAGSGLGEITHKGKIAGTGIGAFNDHFRDAVKGSTRGGHPGFVQNGSQENKVVSGLAGSLDDWAKQPTDSISYVACHDDLCLWDKIAVSSPGASEADRIKMHRMALALVLVAQGKAFIHGGEEFLRTKNGVENSYNAPDSVNRLDWLLKAKHLASYEYVRGIIAIRRAHPMFRLNDRAVVLRRVRFGDGAAPGLIVMEIDGEGVPGETWKRVRVACNATAKGYALQLPAGKWNVAVRGDKASAESLGTVEGQVVVEPRTTLMVWR